MDLSKDGKRPQKRRHFSNKTGEHGPLPASLQGLPGCYSPLSALSALAHGSWGTLAHG